jgi:hypothetical protein
MRRIKGRHSGAAFDLSHHASTDSDSTRLVPDRWYGFGEAGV